MLKPLQAQLFLDDTGIEASAFVTRCWHEPRRFVKPVLEPELPWEQWCPVLFGTVLRREDLWRMWYCGWTRRCRPRVCYAESRDGVTWEKPRFGIFPFADCAETNIVMQSASPDGLIDNLTVITDTQDPAWPLKMLYYDSGGASILPGIYAAQSADGIHWEALADAPVLLWGDRFNAIPVRWKDRFVIFGRPADMVLSRRGRCVYRTESHDLISWTAPTLVLARDLEDPPDLEIYSMSPFPYGDLLMGSIERMHMVPDRLDPEITWSRDDGTTWHRSRPRPAFIPLAPTPSWQDTWINLSASSPIACDGELWFYYSGRGGAHMSPYPLNQGALGLALLRRDGFCSLFAGQRRGWLLTTPLTWPGGDLVVNIDCRLDDRSHPAYCHGDLRVELRQSDGTVLPGYTLADCNPLRTNTVRDPACSCAVRWGQRSADALAGKPVCLHFDLCQTHLYSYHSRPA